MLARKRPAVEAPAGGDVLSAMLSVLLAPQEPAAAAVSGSPEPGLPAARRKETFREYVTRVSPRFRWYPHIVRLAEVLQRVADGELRRVMIFMPPRHGKSEAISRLFSAYYLSRYPERWVGVSSYAAELAYTLSRAARENYTRGGGDLSDSASAVKHWETTQGGGFWAAGVGGPITGKGFHLGIIDDPLKNQEEASSKTIREKQKDWYRSTFYTREEANDGAIVVVQTRWHEDDLSGWLLSEEVGNDEPERWHVVHFEALREDSLPEYPESCTVEPDPREPGEALCPERYTAAKLRKIMRNVGSYVWNALYQGRPRAREGGFFRRAWFEIVEASPKHATRVRYWDKAGTESGGDWTVGVKIARTMAGIYYVEDVVRVQHSPGARDQVILQTAQIDGRGCEQWSEQEPGSSGKADAAAFIRLLAGFTCHTEPASGSKELRAGPFAAQAEAGNVKLVLGAWNRDYLDELTDFPVGKHDDQVDASSGAFNRLAESGGGWVVIA